MRGRSTIVLVALLLAPAPGVRAGAELVLADGRVLGGVDVRLRGGLYELQIDSVRAVAIPVELVVELRLVGEPPGEPAPTGLTRAEPELVAGTPIEPVRRADLLAVFGEPSRFPPSPVDARFRPQSDWSAEGDSFAGRRATWVPGVIDPSWTPRSGFRRPGFSAPRNVIWRRSNFDPSWRPADGFRRGSPRLVAGRDAEALP